MSFFQFLVQCSLSDIRPNSIRNLTLDPEKTEAARDILSGLLHPSLKASNWKGKKLKLILQDEWKSGFVRRFTPLKEDVAKLGVILDADSIQIEFLEGSQKGEILTLENGKVFKGTQKLPQKTSSTKTYLESLKLYLSLPFSLETFSFLVWIPEPSTEKVFFATEGPEALSSQSDQYLYFLNPSLGKVDAVEFTYREVFSFYKGWLTFEEYQLEQNLLYPRKIAIREERNSQDFVHILKIEKIILE